MNGWDENEAFEAAVPLSRRAMAARPGGGGGAARYLDELNPAQRAAVEALDGPVLMLAGAGTGKTKALIARIVHLLEEKRAFPGEILAVTFTNKAAREMKDRVGRLRGEVAEGMPWMGTFHTISAKILRRHAELAGLKSNFTILDTDDQLRLLKQVISLADIDEKRWPARMMAGLIDGWKNRALTPSKVPSAEAGAYNNRGTEIYEAYQARLKTLNAVDFGDLLLHVVTIFQAYPDVLAQYQRRFRYILVDEYQDTNVAQYLWLRLLAQAHRNICCVGDDDQSIYGWRGAEVGNILRFEKDFPGAKVVRLEQNYRSTPHILAAASGVIAANAGRLGKTLWTDVKEGEKVRLMGVWDADEEARWIGEEVEALTKGRRQIGEKSLDDIAILVRASHQMRAFEDRFLTIGLPYRVIGGPRFYERLEVRDAMAYFRLAVSPEDDLAFERVVNTPKRGLGDKAQQAIQRLARASGVSLLDGAREALATGVVGGKGGGAVARLRRWGGPLARAGARAGRGAGHRGRRRCAGRFRADAGTGSGGDVSCRAGRDDPGGVRLHRDVAERQDARGGGAAGEPQGTGQGAGGVRKPARVPGACRADHGERDGRIIGKGQHHDPARGQGAGVSGGLPARLGRRVVSQPAQHG
jgi:DNA helicase II / ATP-dependent DNA helicase PcrA